MYHNQINQLTNNAISDRPAHGTIPAQADPNLVLAPHPDSASPSTSSGSDGDNANNDFFRLQRRWFGEISSSASQVSQSTRNDPIQVNTSIDDGGDIVNTLLYSNEREVSSTSEEGTETQNEASSLHENSSPPSAISVPSPPSQQPPPLLGIVPPTPT